MVGALPIAVSEILNFHDHLGIGDQEEFLYLVQQMDEEWLKLTRPPKTR